LFAVSLNCFNISVNVSGLTDVKKRFLDMETAEDDSEARTDGSEFGTNEPNGTEVETVETDGA
jgi:hypothetical protein